MPLSLLTADAACLCYLLLPSPLALRSRSFCPEVSTCRDGCRTHPPVEKKMKLIISDDAAAVAVIVQKLSCYSLTEPAGVDLTILRNTSDVAGVMRSRIPLVVGRKPPACFTHSRPNRRFLKNKIALRCKQEALGRPNNLSFCN